MPERIAEIVAGVAEGCVQAGAALIGGETAEMPGFYPEDEYDLAGFAVGIVDRERILDSSAMREGDALIALPSSGVHSNGFSLVRRVFEVEGGALERYEPELGRTLGEALLEPTRIYVKPVLALLRSARLSAISHITGGGFYENVPRALAPGFTARIEKAKLKTPPLFSLIARAGNIPERDMYNTFNMGVGMLAAVAAEDADAAVRCLRENGVEAYVCGEVERGEGGVELW